MMVEVEVRCCCTPTRLYGWLQVPAEAVKRGRVVQLVRRTPINARVCSSEHFEIDVWRLSLEEFFEEGQWRLALKADGDDRTTEQKLDFLRTLREFREAQQ